MHTGGVVWGMYGNPGYVFRAQRINSLYRPRVEVAAAGGTSVRLANGAGP